MRVAIIGAGPGGLAAAKYLIAEKFFSKITIYEQRDEVGGVWCYNSDNTIDDDFAIPHTKPRNTVDTPLCVKHDEPIVFQSPVYDLLETNIPRCLMNYSDWTFPESTPLFPSHRDVKRYLEGYAEELLSYITFHTQVIDVRRPDEATAHRAWNVNVRNLKTHEISTHQHDFVVVANGHYNDHYIPDIKGIKEWRQRMPTSTSHSKHYRRPETFKNQKVVVVGNSASGLDLSVQIAAFAQQPLLLSAKSESPPHIRNHPHLSIVPEIVEFLTQDRSLRFLDGRIEKNVDHVIFCTGYLYSFPFLSSLQPPVQTPNGSRPDHLFQHIFYYFDPTLTFIGLPLKIIPFPLSEAQAAVVARVYSGRLSLPSQVEMGAWEENWIAEHGSEKNFNVLGFPLDADYLNYLHHWSLKARRDTRLANCGLGKIPPFWGPREKWMRKLTPTIKAASQALDDKRKHIHTLAQLGFSYNEDSVSKI